MHKRVHESEIELLKKSEASETSEPSQHKKGSGSSKSKSNDGSKHESHETPTHLRSVLSRRSMDSPQTFHYEAGSMISESSNPLLKTSTQVYKPADFDNFKSTFSDSASSASKAIYSDSGYKGLTASRSIAFSNQSALSKISEASDASKYSKATKTASLFKSDSMASGAPDFTVEYKGSSESKYAAISNASALSKISDVSEGIEESKATKTSGSSESDFVPTTSKVSDSDVGYKRSSASKTTTISNASTLSRITEVSEASQATKTCGSYKSKYLIGTKTESVTTHKTSTISKSAISRDSMDSVILEELGIINPSQTMHHNTVSMSSETLNPIISKTQVEKLAVSDTIKCVSKSNLYSASDVGSKGSSVSKSTVLMNASARSKISEASIASENLKTTKLSKSSASEKSKASSTNTSLKSKTDTESKDSTSPEITSSSNTSKLLKTSGVSKPLTTSDSKGSRVRGMSGSKLSLISKSTASSKKSTASNKSNVSKHSEVSNLLNASVPSQSTTASKSSKSAASISPKVSKTGEASIHSGILRMSKALSVKQAESNFLPSNISSTSKSSRVFADSKHSKTSAISQMSEMSQLRVAQKPSLASSLIFKVPPKASSVATKSPESFNASASSNLSMPPKLSSAHPSITPIASLGMKPRMSSMTVSLASTVSKHGAPPEAKTGAKSPTPSQKSKPKTVKPAVPVKGKEAPKVGASGKKAPEKKGAITPSAKGAQPASGKGAPPAPVKQPPQAPLPPPPAIGDSISKKLSSLTKKKAASPTTTSASSNKSSAASLVNKIGGYIYGARTRQKKKRKTSARIVPPVRTDKHTQVRRFDMEHDEDEDEDEESGRGGSAGETFAGDEPLEPGEEKPISFTGFFADDDELSPGPLKRVDYVLVLTESENEEHEKLKVEFLVNIIKAGLQLEFEIGVLPVHSNLLFIKIHAPDKVLVEYGQTFEVKKLFRDKHEKFMKRKPSLITRLFCLSHEKEWLHLVRKSYQPPLKLSTLERSYIVYMLMLHQRFGPAYNQSSLKRLEEFNLVLDSYALHDGPYFYMVEQDFHHVSARQILFYNWLGKRNALREQPLSLIYEYYGSKIAFYFAFYDYCNRGLLLSSVIGLATTSLQYVSGRHTYSVVKESLCCERGKRYCDEYMCPTCNNFRLCPFKKGIEYCTTIKIINFLDNKYTLYYCCVLSIGVTFFVIYWRRYESYWSWLWELCYPPLRHTVRPEYSVSEKKPKRSQITGIMKFYEDIIIKIARIIVVKCILFLISSPILFIFLYIVTSRRFFMDKWKESETYKFKKYVMLSVNCLVVVPLMIIIEELFKLLAYYVTKLENHRTYESFEKSVILKIFPISCMCTFLPMVYVGWIKGAFYQFPHRHWFPTLVFQWKYVDLNSSGQILPPLGDFIHSTCGPFGCFDELALVLVLTALIRIVVWKLAPFAMPYKTDYNIKKKILLTTAAYEREFSLKTFTERKMLDYYNDLVLHFALMTLFVVACPLLPIVGFLAGLYHMRFQAQQLLVCTRRPVLIKGPDIGPWNGVLSFIVGSIGFSNAITIVRCTNTIYRYLYLKYSHPADLSKFLDFKLAKFSLKALLYTGWMYLNKLPTNLGMNSTVMFNHSYVDTAGKALSPFPLYCYFEGLHSPTKRPTHIEFIPWIPGLFEPKVAKYHKNYLDMFFIMVFECFVVIVLLAFKLTLPTMAQKYQDIRQMEINLKRTHAVNLPMGKKTMVLKEVDPTK